MKFVDHSYEKTLSDLAAELVSPERFGGMAMQDTVEFEPVMPEGMRLRNPVELGWELTIGDNIQLGQE